MGPQLARGWFAGFGAFPPVAYPPVLWLAIFWNPEVAMAMAQTSWDHLADGSWMPEWIPKLLTKPSQIDPKLTPIDPKLCQTEQN